VDFSELVINIASWSQPEIKEILKRYPFDFEWWNDYNFIVRYLVGAFVPEYQEFNADSM